MARDPRTEPQRRRPTSVKGMIARASERVDGYKTPIGIAVLALAAFLAYTAFKATTGPPFLPKYRITVKVPADAPPLRKGEAVRVGGSLAGLINDVRPDPKSGKTLVELNISKTHFRPLPVDTTAFVRVHSIVYLTYLGLTPGTSKENLKDGDTLAAEAQSGTDLLEVVELFDKQARQDLSKTLVNVGYGAAGRGTELNGSLRDLPATSSYLRDQLRAATRTPGALGKVISGGAATAAGLRGSRPDDLASLISFSEKTFGATARQSAALSQAIALLRPFENEVLATTPVADPTLREISLTSKALRPAVRNLEAQLPALNRLAKLGPELREGFTALLGGGAGGAGGGGAGGSTGTGSGQGSVANAVLKAARPVVSGLFPIQTAVGPLNKSLAQLLAAVRPYLPEIQQAGQWLQEASRKRYAGGKNANSPALRLIPILSPHPCVNAEPAPGQAQKDSC